MSVSAVTPNAYPGADVLAASVAPVAATLTPQAGATANSYQTQYANLQQADAAELLLASGFTTDQAVANATSVFGQAAKILGTPGQLPAQAGASATATTPSTVPSPNLVIASTGKSYVPVTSAIDPAPLEVDLFSESTIAAQNALFAYAKSGGTGSILDYQS